MLFRHTPKKDLNNPDNFRLKIVPSWFSKEYCTFKYSTNKGRSWNTIYEINQPILSDENWTSGAISYRIGNGDFEAEKIKFGSYEKIKKYHDELEIRYAEKKQERRDQWRREKETLNNAYDRANK
jgi:hypothetical protein